MRVVYMDEAGISANEPALVVVSIVIDGDRQYAALKNDLAQIASTHLPEEDRNGFIFHATDLFSGRKYFAGDKWPREKRWAILEEILRLVPKHSISVCLCFASQDDFRKKAAQIGRPEWSEYEAHILAFIFCILTVDHWMRDHADHELAILVVEDVNEKKSKMKDVFAHLSDPNRMGKIPLSIPPVTRIVDTPHFVRKSESAILQIADAWAFLVRRKLLDKPDVEYFASVFDEAEMYMKRFADVLPR